jgi:hypothetical protein
MRFLRSAIRWLRRMLVDDVFEVYPGLQESTVEAAT